MSSLSIVTVTDNSIISSSRDGTVCVWNKESLELVKTLQKHSDEINCMQTTVCGYFLAGQL